MGVGRERGRPGLTARLLGRGQVLVRQARPGVPHIVPVLPDGVADEHVQRIPVFALGLGVVGHLVRGEPPGGLGDEIRAGVEQAGEVRGRLLPGQFEGVLRVGRRRLLALVVLQDHPRRAVEVHDGLPQGLVDVVVGQHRGPGRVGRRVDEAEDRQPGRGLGLVEVLQEHRSHLPVHVLERPGNVLPQLLEEPVRHPPGVDERCRDGLVQPRHEVQAADLVAEAERLRHGVLVGQHDRVRVAGDQFDAHSDLGQRELGRRGRVGHPAVRAGAVLREQDGELYGVGVVGHSGSGSFGGCPRLASALPGKYGSGSSQRRVVGIRTSPALPGLTVGRRLGEVADLGGRREVLGAARYRWRPAQPRLPVEQPVDHGLGEVGPGGHDHPGRAAAQEPAEVGVDRLPGPSGRFPTTPCPPSSTGTARS